jgi:chromosome segregation protein
LQCVVGLEKDAERISQDLDRAQASLERAKAEDRRLESEIGGIIEETSAARRGIEEAATALSLGDRRRREIEADLAARRAALDAQIASVTELKVSLAQAREKEEALRQGLEQMTAQREELTQRVARIGAECDAITSRAASRLREQQALRADLERHREDELERLRTFEASRTGAEELRRKIEEAERALTQARGELDRVRQEKAGSEVSFTEQTLRRDNVVDTMRERYEVDLASIEVGGGEESELEARCQALQQKIGRMDRSTIGLEAMEELGSMEQRRAFLANEKADLERSIADLQKTISNLNRVSRERFAETFVAVNEKFQETFPKLFRGGRAYLALTDENDLMEAGVDIHVQPPGMNLRALSLLSGGQKALTAVSLIFALFMCRPSPFCVLDEVDAPLDDANIDRFNHIVTEMGRESQFLVITHNQRTMEVADRLYGVTMEEPGVSKIVSVRLKTAA